MKAAEIRLGGHYLAKVGDRLTTVRVDAIRKRGEPFKGEKEVTVYDVTNLVTGRKTTFRSAAKFRKAVTKEQRPYTKKEALEDVCAASGCSTDTQSPLLHSIAAAIADPEPEAEQRPDPTPVSGSSPTSSPASATAGPAVSSPAPSGLAARLAQRESLSDDSPHLIIEARAGTGKTTTLVEGLKVLMGEPTRIEPSPQQRAVWDALYLSRGRAKSVCFVAFNKSIATELQQRVPKGCDAMTMHSLGFKAVTKALGRVEPNQYVVQDLIAELTGRDLRDLRKDDVVLLKATGELVSLCKMNLADPTPENLDRLTSHYGVDLNGSRSQVYELVPRVLDRCKTPRGKINFDDMIWLPVVLNLPVQQYDLLLVDEAQDLNRCQQALAKRAGRRLVLVGDPRQAIYGFAGADAESMRRMEDELSGPPCVNCGAAPWGTREGPSFVNGRYSCACGAPLSGNGCQVLPLTVTRRCGKAIVEEARRIVPDFEAHESNPEGKVGRKSFKKEQKVPTTAEQDAQNYRSWVLDGDFVLCRCNAPLVSECFRFIRAGRKANIQGRDVGKGLTSLVEKIEGKDKQPIPVPEFIARLGDWLAAEEAKENAKRNPSETRLQGLQDRHDCLVAFTVGAATIWETTTADVKRKIDTVFTDDKTSPGIKLSSIHKAKGLEAKRVFYLLADGDRAFGPPLDKLQGWEREQEQNLKYVAITRAIEELVYVS